MPHKPTILVTGGAGYIGAHACRALALEGFSPVVFDNLCAGNAGRVKWGPLVQGDVRNPADLDAAFAAHKPAAVMHFAAQISVPGSVKDPLTTYTTNTLGSLNVLNAMAKYGVKTLVVSSTAAVYGTPESVPIPELAPLTPINPYGQSKLMVECMLADVVKADPAFKFAALRYFNAAGALPEEGLGYTRPDPFHLIPMVMLATLGKVPPLSLFGTDYPTPDGTAVRDYVHVADLADAHVLALQSLLRGGDNLVLNLGSTKGMSVKEIATLSPTITGRPLPHVWGPRRAGDPASLVADATAAHALLGWKPTRSGLEDILRSDWAWHKGLA